MPSIIILAKVEINKMHNQVHIMQDGHFSIMLLFRLFYINTTVIIWKIIFEVLYILLGIVLSITKHISHV